MQRVSPRASWIGLALAGGLIAAMLVFMLTMGGQGTPKAQALNQTPTPTPKPAGTGNLSGLFDINAGPGLYNCISRTDHDGGTNIVKSAAQCYTQLDTGAPGGEPPCAAWHGPGPQGANPSVPIRAGEGPCAPDAGNVQQPLMPPPPPYTAQQPSHLVGSYCPAGPNCAAIPGDTQAVLGDTLTEAGCFADIGGTLGPNVISVVVLGTGRVGDAPLKAGLKVQDPSGTPGTIISGWTFLILNATNAQCTAANGGTVPAALPATQTWIPLSLTRRATTRDFDGDTCTDMVELGHGQSDSVKACGDDPFNPYDAAGATPNITGSYDNTMEITRSDLGVPGKYVICKVVIAAGGTGGAICYPDSTTETVNPAAAGDTKCIAGGGTANAQFCGDGQPGAAPPGCNSVAATCAALAGQGTGCPTLPCNVSQYQYAPLTKSANLTWSVSGQTETVIWCQQYGAVKAGTSVYIAINKLDIYTRVGKDIIYYGMAATDCKAYVDPSSIHFLDPAILASATSTQSTFTVDVRQAPGVQTDQTGAGTLLGCLQNGSPPGSAIGYANCRDSDGDGCPDKIELTGTAIQGGVRDPYNRWDYFNPEKVNTPHKQTAADILYVVGQFGKNQGNAAYTIDADRTGILGGNAWTLGPPDGKETAADILAAVAQFGHNC